MFSAFLAIFHVALIWLHPLNQVAWKKVDYIWLGFASLSLIGAVTQDRRVEARAALEFSKPAFERAAFDVLDSAKFGREYYCERPFHRTEFSPSNFDWIVAQQALACAWYKNAVAVIATEEKKPRPDMRSTLLHDNPHITDQIPRNDMKALYKLMAAADALEQKEDAWKAMADQTDFDAVVVRLSPIMLAFALALRITKVTGELRLSRTRR